MLSYRGGRGITHTHPANSHRYFTTVRTHTHNVSHKMNNNIISGIALQFHMLRYPGLIPAAFNKPPDLEAQYLYPATKNIEMGRAELGKRHLFHVIASSGKGC